MELLEKNFNDHIREWCGPKARVLLMTDNLDAQVFDDKKDILSKDGRVVGLFCPLFCTEIVQPTDSGYEQSIRCYIVHQLDAWLMEADHLEIWEKVMTVEELRVLICKSVTEANMEVMVKDDSLVSHFHCRSGVLLTLDGTGDELIRPQGCTKISTTVLDLVYLTLDENHDTPNEVVLLEALEFDITNK